jgi:hypothetical protein
MRAIIRNSFPIRAYKFLQDLNDWRKRDFSAPSPHFIKQQCVIRNSLTNATWVETGTYLGETTALLSKYALKVFSIEPEPTLYANAVKNFASFGNVEILKGTSEDVFPDLLPKLSGNVCYWLDGHYSGAGTHKGPMDTPIMSELIYISNSIPKTTSTVVMIDDIRLFNGDVHSYGAYPSLDFLVQWANENKLKWHIEQDIFIARTH